VTTCVCGSQPIFWQQAARMNDMVRMGTAHM